MSDILGVDIGLHGALAVVRALDKQPSFLALIDVPLAVIGGGRVSTCTLLQRSYSNIHRRKRCSNIRKPSRNKDEAPASTSAAPPARLRRFSHYTE